MKNKIFTRIIITTLLCAFLTFNVGKVTRVSAVGTTIAASAAAALCAVGIVYCSYMALTGASVHVPDTVDNIESWLTDIGSKVVQYPSGRDAYEELYAKNLALSPEGNLIRDFIDSEVWTWSANKIKSWTNDFSSVEINQSICTYENTLNTLYQVTNQFDYDFSITPVDSTVLANNNLYDFESFMENYNCTIDFNLTVPFIVTVGNLHTFSHVLSDENTQFRNYLKTNNKYGIQKYVNGTWQHVGSVDLTNGVIHFPNSSLTRYLDITTYNNNLTYWYVNSYSIRTVNDSDYPLLPQSPTYVEATGETIEVVPVQEIEVVKNPQWPTLPPEDDNKPVIPYAKLPYDPTWIDPITGSPGGGNWGINLGRLLDVLEDLAGTLMEIGAIGELINEFKNLISGQSGDEYYIYYDDSTNNYYQYYTITNFGDTNYTYNINVSDVDEHLPVDLNTIQTYSNNRYLEQIKQSAINGSSIVRDLAVFWYDVDPEVTYIVLGCCILILIGAFTGKLGHS